MIVNTPKALVPILHLMLQQRMLEHVWGSPKRNLIGKDFYESRHMSRARPEAGRIWSLNRDVTGKARLVLLASVLLLLSLSGLIVPRGLTAFLPPPPVRLSPTLNYGEVSGDSQVNASMVLGGCLQLTSWGTPLQSGNKVSVTASVVDSAGPGIFCPAVVFVVEHTYGLGQLSAGNYSFTLTACIVFPHYGGAVDCSNEASIFFQAGVSNPKPPPPTSDKIKLEYQEINGIAFVNASIVVPPCFRMRGWGDASQSGNSFRSNVTIVDDERLMIACIAIDTSAQNSYSLGHLAPGFYSFTLNLCEVVIGWGTTGTTGTNITIDCSNTITIFFVVPGNPAPQPPPAKDWNMLFGPFAIIILILLRLLGIPMG